MRNKLNALCHLVGENSLLLVSANKQMSYCVFTLSSCDIPSSYLFVLLFFSEDLGKLSWSGIPNPVRHTVWKLLSVSAKWHLVQSLSTTSSGNND